MENELLLMCLDLAKHIVNNKQNTTIIVKVGKEFSFDFINKNEHVKKKISPSQNKRNMERKERFQKTKVNEEKQKANIKTEPDFKEVAVQTDPIDKKVDLVMKAIQTNQSNPLGQTALEVKSLEEIKITEQVDKDKIDYNGHFEEDQKDEERNTNVIQLKPGFKCYLCNSNFSTKSNMKKHHNYHHKDRPIRYTCDRCDENWKHEEMLNSHKGSEHNIYICARCNTQFIGKQKLDEHFRLKHRAF